LNQIEATASNVRKKRYVIEETSGGTPWAAWHNSTISPGSSACRIIRNPMH
jgi:hypothetical protein